MKPEFPAQSRPPGVTGARTAVPPPAGRPPIDVAWARHADEVRQAQRLRYEVFARELGACLETPLAGHDIDRFDDYCEHLLVRDGTTREVIGTYRVLTPSQAARAGGTYCDGQFDLAPLRHLRPRMAELGRSCVHAHHRHGGVILALWGALAHFMASNGLDTMIGSASIPLRHTAPHGLAAASIWHQLRRTHMAPLQLQVIPRVPFPLDDVPPPTDVEPPALIRGYLRLGTKLLGPPAWDHRFSTADLPMLVRMADLHPRYRRSCAGG